MDEIEKIRLKFDIDKKIDLNFDNNNKLKVLMLKGDDGFDPYIISARSGKTTTVTITDYYGTQSFDIYDGVDPTVTASRDGNKTTLTITDIDGTRTADIYDGIDLTGGVPTDGVIGWDNKDISYTCDGTESGDYYLTYNSVDYYFTMPTVEAGDTLLFNTVDLTLKLNGTTISTAASGTGTELTFVEYIPNGYEEETNGIATQTDLTTKQDTLVSGTNIKTINNTSILGSGNINITGSSPIGSITMFAGNTAPSGYLICDGSAISRNDYADLFTTIGTTYGTGDGSTTFNLPNIKGRVPVGYDSTQTEFNAIGKTGGSKELQQHNHTIVSNSNDYVMYWADQSGNLGTASGTQLQGYNNKTTANTGTGNSGNLQPYLVVNYIIKY